MSIPAQELINEVISDNVDFSAGRPSYAMVCNRIGYLLEAVMEKMNETDYEFFASLLEKK